MDVDVNNIFEYFKENNLNMWWIVPFLFFLAFLIKKDFQAAIIKLLSYMFPYFGLEKKKVDIMLRTIDNADSSIDEKKIHLSMLKYHFKFLDKKMSKRNIKENKKFNKVGTGMLSYFDIFFLICSAALVLNKVIRGRDFDVIYLVFCIAYLFKIIYGILFKKHHTIND